MHIERVRDAASDAVADYARLTDVTLRSADEPEHGLYIAESAKVIRRAIGAGHQPRSVLMEEKWLAGLEAELAPFDVPVHLQTPTSSSRSPDTACTGAHSPRSNARCCPTRPTCSRARVASWCSRTSSTTPTWGRSSARSRRSAPTRCS